MTPSRWPMKTPGPAELCAATSCPLLGPGEASRSSTGSWHSRRAQLHLGDMLPSFGEPHPGSLTQRGGPQTPSLPASLSHPALIQGPSSTNRTWQDPLPSGNSGWLGSPTQETGGLRLSSLPSLCPSKLLLLFLKVLHNFSPWHLSPNL